VPAILQAVLGGEQMKSFSDARSTANAGIDEQWDGFEDPFWNVGQLILWAATGNRRYVDQASDNCGEYGELYGCAAAAVLIEQHVPNSQQKVVARKVRRMAMKGHLKATSDSGDIPALTWARLEIGFDSAMPIIRWRGHQGVLSAYSNVRFLRDEVLREFFSSTQLKRGHKAGEPWLAADEPCFAEMLTLLQNGKAKDVSNAARKLCDRAVSQGGTPESVQKRLARHFPRWRQAREA
jgi:hypothetical protein